MSDSTPNKGTSTNGSHGPVDTSDEGSAAFKGIAIIGFVCALLSAIPTLWMLVFISLPGESVESLANLLISGAGGVLFASVIVWLCGFVFSLVALIRRHRLGDRTRRLAVAGMVVAVVAIPGLGMLMILLIAALFFDAFCDGGLYC